MICPVLSSKQCINILPADGAFRFFQTKLQIAIITNEETNIPGPFGTMVQTMNSTDALREAED